MRSLRTSFNKFYSPPVDDFFFFFFFFFSEPVGDSASPASLLDLFFFFFFFSDDASALFRFFVGAEVTTPGGAEPSRGSRVALGKKRALISLGWSLPL